MTGALIAAFVAIGCGDDPSDKRGRLRGPAHVAAADRVCARYNVTSHPIVVGNAHVSIRQVARRAHSIYPRFRLLIADLRAALPAGEPTAARFIRLQQQKLETLSRMSKTSQLPVRRATRALNADFAEWYALDRRALALASQLGYEACGHLAVLSQP